MKFHFNALLAAVCLVTATLSAHALAPSDAPSGSTAQCNDGTYTSVDKKAGACRGHKGIKNWFGAADASAAKTAPPVAAPAAPASAEAKPAAKEAPAAMAPAAPSSKTAAAPKNTPPATAAAGGGAGKVWANSETKVYHCMGDRYYGKTKKGEYMSEADAKAKGMHPSHKKACAS